jgi:methyl-accepting chemotaxis protein
MNNTKVSTRLSWSFGILIALLVLIGALSVTRLGRVSDEMKVITDVRSPNLQALNDLALMAMDNARVARNIILVSDAADKAKNDGVYGKNSNEEDKRIAQLKASLTDEKEGALLSDLVAAREAYAAYTQEVIKLGLAGKEEEATKLLYGENYKTQAAFFAAIKRLVDSEHDKLVASGVEAAATYIAARNVVIGLGTLSCLIGIVMAVVITRGLLKQLGGEPAYATEVARRIAQGDLSVAVITAAVDRTSLLAAMRAMQDSLGGVVSSVRQNSESVATASAQISQGNRDLSQRTEEQASSLQETAASMEQLSSTVKQNADNAQQANQLALGASTVATKGGEVVGEVVTTMKGINASSRKIADIISVIDGIAFQTNILALNAAVEAARAGEQGRGFAVVATEVRSLAGRSAEAAREIKSLITDSVERVEQGTALVDQAGATMTEVVSAIRRVTDIMGEISAASTEQSAGVAQVGEAVSQMDQVTQQNAALVEESAAAAESLKAQAHALVQAVAFFKVDAHAGDAAAVAPRRGAVPQVSPPRERRGPDRARNVVRPKFGAIEAAPAKREPLAPAAAHATPKTGTDDWESF